MGGDAHFALVKNMVNATLRAHVRRVVMVSAPQAL